MANDEFQARLERLKSKTQEEPRATKRFNNSGGFSWIGALKGFALSLVIGYAFTNMQAISDMAPQSIKDGPAPGLFGLPIAVISVLWIIITPIWFLRTVTRAATSGWRVSPAGFPIGLFAGLALMVLAMQVGIGFGLF